MMRYEETTAVSLYAADTPYQILSCVCDVVNRGDECADIAIYGQFDDAKATVANLRNAGVFNTVHYIAPYYEHCANMNIKYYLTATCFSETRKAAFYKAAPTLAEGKRYSRFFFGSGSPFTHDLRMNCCLDEAQSVLLEDGTGLYNYKVINDMTFLDNMGGSRAGKRELIKRAVRAFTGQRFLFNVSEIHGFKGDQLGHLYPQTTTKELAIDQYVIDVLLRVFGDSAKDLILQNRCIFFTLPDDVSEEVISIENRAIKRAVKSQSGSVVLRLHPRSTRQVADYVSRDDISKVSVSKGESWETYCLSGAVDESKVLIGFGSTAQTTPLELCGIEPYIIFLPFILPDDYHAKAALVDIAKNYLLETTHDERVFMPKTLDEFSDLMSRLACI